MKYSAGVALTVERLFSEQNVAGSNPVTSFLYLVHGVAQCRAASQ